MNVFAAPWRPAQVRLAPVMGQTTISTAPAAARPSLIDSPLMAIILDATIGVGAALLAIGKYREAKQKGKPAYRKISYLLFGVTGVAAVKFWLDGSQLGQ